MELAPTMPARDASIAFGIFAEKMQLLAGEATHIVGKEEHIRHADFNALIESLPAANAREVTEMGLPGDPQPQKALPNLDPGARRPPLATTQLGSSARLALAIHNLLPKRQAPFAPKNPEIRPNQNAIIT